VLGFRAKLNNEPELVELIRTRFVAVAVDHEVERRKDSEGELYRKVAGKAVSNSLFAFDPSGKVLFQRLGGQIYQKFVPALKAAIKDYKPARADAKKVPTGADRDEHFYPVPTDAVVVHVTSRMTTRGTGWPGPKRWGRDNMWVRRDEVAALARGQLPGSLEQRIARFHLINTTGGHLTSGAMWKPEHVRRLDMRLARGRLTGEVTLEGWVRGPVRNDHSRYSVRLLGFVEVKGGKLTRFDVVAVGTACRVAGSGPGIESHGEVGVPYTLAIGFRLSTDRDSDAQRRTPPAAVHYGRKAGYTAYLGHAAEPEKASVTELKKVAARMKPGTWAILQTKGYTADLLRVQNHHILEYTGAAAWDPTSGQVLFVGQGHYSALKFISYGAATNTWKLRATPSWWKGDAKTGKGPIGHAYYNNTIDPARGQLYHHQSSTRLVHRYDVAGDKWTTLPEIRDAPVGHGTAIAWFPERKELVRVLGGTVHFFQPEKDKWTKHTDRLAMGPYHNVARYSAAHKVVLFGGGNNSKDLYTLDAKGKITRLKPAPVEVGINTAVLTVDPVSGDFLVLHRDDRFYSFNPITDTWKTLDTKGMPFAMKGSSFDVVATPVSNHGVILFFTAARKGLKVCLYRHAAPGK
jgi:hypothetical protein